MAKDQNLVRIKNKLADFIREVAEENDETFLEALYRIINFYRDTKRSSQSQPQVKENIVSTVSVIEQKEQKEQEEQEEGAIEIDTDIFA